YTSVLWGRWIYNTSLSLRLSLPVSERSRRLRIGEHQKVSFPTLQNSRIDYRVASTPQAADVPRPLPPWQLSSVPSLPSKPHLLSSRIAVGLRRGHTPQSGVQRVGGATGRSIEEEGRA
ncbi:hypothetical protein NDU88_002757, partial [Pleurodeles waltl]